MSYAYQSGWCLSCGRRRGGDGRCSNCDPWWTSPLIQVGFPVLAVVSIVLVIIAVSVRPLRDDPALPYSNGGQALFPTMAPQGGLLTPGSPNQPAPPARTLSAPPVSVPAFTPPPMLAFSSEPTLSPAQVALEHLNYLHEQVRVANAAMRQRETAEYRYQRPVPVPYFKTLDNLTY